jgi:ribosomal protein S11
MINIKEWKKEENNQGNTQLPIIKNNKNINYVSTITEQQQENRKGTKEILHKGGNLKNNPQSQNPDSTQNSGNMWGILKGKGEGNFGDKKTKNNEQTGGIYCCNAIMRIKKNNVFINITKLNGQTIIKYSTGLIQKKKNKKQLRTSAKWIIEKIAIFMKRNFNCVKIKIKGQTNKTITYLKEMKRKKIKIITYENNIQNVHNGCRPPKKRRI